MRLPETFLLLALALTIATAIGPRVPLWIAVLFVIVALLVERWGR